MLFRSGFFGLPWFRGIPNPNNQTPKNGQQPKAPNFPRRGFPGPGRGITPTVTISGATLTDVVADSPAAKAKNCAVPSASSVPRKR